MNFTNNLNYIVKKMVAVAAFSSVAVNLALITLILIA